ncbi:uncharacterized protein LOC135639687 isoform X2 [Musa acuminata AAA Group]|uniref:uncharacterized protein LOC135639687 isoform X2 n=1 Tax=Musa acuminata AAA Group TaxID=214697 RepID=UPI0031DFAC56
MKPPSVTAGSPDSHYRMAAQSQSHSESEGPPRLGFLMEGPDPTTTTTPSAAKRTLAEGENYRSSSIIPPPPSADTGAGEDPVARVGVTTGEAEGHGGHDDGGDGLLGRWVRVVRSARRARGSDGGAGVPGPAAGGCDGGPPGWVRGRRRGGGREGGRRGDVGGHGAVAGVGGGRQVDHGGHMRRLPDGALTRRGGRAPFLSIKLSITKKRTYQP